MPTSSSTSTSTPTNPTTYRPYHEPPILTILTLTSFLLALNVLNSLLDGWIYCGLLAQVGVGVVWGRPGLDLLGGEEGKREGDVRGEGEGGFEGAVVGLGYLGLMLMVYEGGLATNIPSLKANLLLSTLVATTGIILPITLSFVLVPLLNATPLQCFAAGAALCSTSLGTTFTILRTSGLARSKLGVVLASAAMMDDVVGLVMVQVISNLWSASAGVFSWRTVVRPLGVSLGFAIGVPVICLLIRPLAGGERKGWEHVGFVVQTGFLLGMVTAAIYAGTSSLFAAYLAGAVVSWWDGARESGRKNMSNVNQGAVVETPSGDSTPPRPHLADRGGRIHDAGTPKSMTGVEVYEKYYATAVTRVLKPFFFILWRGIVYTILMVVAKLATGLWLVRLNFSWPKMSAMPAIKRALATISGCMSRTPTENKKATGVSASVVGHEVQSTKVTAQAPSSAGQESSMPSTSQPSNQTQTSHIQKPLSLYPATMIGTAMVARGEIGFLITSVAASTGLFDTSQSDGQRQNSSSEIYLVVTWAVVLCTIIGPLSVGSLVRRVKRLEGEEVMEGGTRVDGPLGVWGLD